MARRSAPRQDIHSFALAGLLPAGQVLVLNQTVGTVACLTSHLGSPMMLREQQFAPSEICVLLPLLKSYPHYCSYEILLASFNNTNVNDLTIAQSRDKLRAARHAGTWDQEMRPVRNVLSRTRLKLHRVGIEVVSLFETGYILMPLSIETEEKHLVALELVTVHSA